MSLQRMSDKIERSKILLFNFLENSITYGTVKILGSMRILSKRSESKIVCTIVSMDSMTSKEIVSQI